MTKDNEENGKKEDNRMIEWTPSISPQSAETGREKTTVDKNEKDK